MTSLVENVTHNCKINSFQHVPCKKKSSMKSLVVILKEPSLGDWSIGLPKNIPQRSAVPHVGE